MKRLILEWDEGSVDHIATELNRKKSKRFWQGAIYGDEAGQADTSPWANRPMATT